MLGTPLCSESFPGKAQRAVHIIPHRGKLAKVALLFPNFGNQVAIIINTGLQAGASTKGCLKPFKRLPASAPLSHRTEVRCY
jgi:hypothetical protein